MEGIALIQVAGRFGLSAGRCVAAHSAGPTAQRHSNQGDPPNTFVAGQWLSDRERTDSDCRISSA